MKWPIFTHENAICFNCGELLYGSPVRTVSLGIGGDFEQYCERCDMRTFYDTPKPGDLDGDKAKKGENHE